MRWKSRCKEWKEVRQMIWEGDTSGIMKSMLKICKKYAEQKWDFADDFERMVEDLEVVVDDDLDDEEVDYYLNDFYDLCDYAGVWLEV